MIIDAFTYFNEEDILRIRLEELDNVVDRFVLVEARQTFTGQEKDLYFDQLPSWIDRWKDRIKRVIVEFPASTITAWEREAFQRNQIMIGIEDAPPEAFLLISDVDEIPRAESLITVDEPVQLDVINYFWRFNWQAPQHCNQGARPVLVRVADIQKPQKLRASVLPRIPRAGWHFSFFASNSSVQRKISSFSHIEMNTQTFKSDEHISKCINEGIDPFDRFPLKYVDIDTTFPQWVQDNQTELSHLMHIK